MREKIAAARTAQSFRIRVTRANPQAILVVLERMTRAVESARRSRSTPALTVAASWRCPPSAVPCSARECPSAGLCPQPGHAGASEEVQQLEQECCSVIASDNALYVPRDFSCRCLSGP